MSENILEITGLNKHFGPTHANRNIDFSVKKGEIHGLIGENGSGKSTLLSQIAGMYPRDSGQMLVNGEPYDPASPIDANERGISMVMQELGVVGGLPAGVNVFLGRTKQFSRFGIGKPVHAGDTVADLENLTDFFETEGGIDVLQLLEEHLRNLTWFYIIVLRHIELHDSAVLFDKLSLDKFKLMGN